MRGVAADIEHLHGLSIVHGDASLKNREDVVAVADKTSVKHTQTSTPSSLPMI